MRGHEHEGNVFHLRGDGQQRGLDGLRLRRLRLRRLVLLRELSENN